MNDIVSYCGLICIGCPVLWATNEKDEILKEKMRCEIAILSNKLYQTDYTAKDISDCAGCLAEDPDLFPGCVNCEIRNCAREKEISNCAHCNDYTCERLDAFFKDNPESKSRLDFIRSLLD